MRSTEEVVDAIVASAAAPPLSEAFPPRDGSDQELVELAAHYLVIAGWIEEPDDVIYTELGEALKGHGSCIIARGDIYCRDAEQLAHCWAHERRLDWERHAERFECACGTSYAVENDGWEGHVFYALAADGTFEEQVKECPCGRVVKDVRRRRREAAATGVEPLFE